MKRFLPNTLMAGLVLAGLLVPVRPAQAATTTATVQTAWNRYSINQLDGYEVKASAGPLTVQATDVTAPTVVVLVNAADGSVLHKDVFTPEHLSFQVDVPAASTYVLMLAPNQVGQVTLTGSDVTISPEVPAVKLPTLQQFQWITQPLTVTAAVVNPAVTTKLEVYLVQGGVQSALQTVSQEPAPLLAAAPAVDGTIAPVTIDPAKLTDGVYTLVGSGTGTDENIGGLAMRTLVVDKAPVFSDVPATQWARRWVDTLSYLGVVNGRGPGSFAPGAEVKRSEFAKMLALALGLPPAPATANDFVDVPEDWSRPYIEALYQAKLITGDVVNGQRYYYPNKSISRAEAATIIGRAQGIADGAYTGATDFTDFGQVPTYAQHAVVTLTQRQVLTGFPDKTFRPLQTLQRDQAAKILGSLIGITQ